MKDQKGITLTSLVIYIIVMIIILGVLSSIINKFYEMFCSSTIGSIISYFLS